MFGKWLGYGSECCDLKKRNNSRSFSSSQNNRFCTLHWLVNICQCTITTNYQNNFFTLKIMQLHLLGLYITITLPNRHGRAVRRRGKTALHQGACPYGATARPRQRFPNIRESLALDWRIFSLRYPQVKTLSAPFCPVSHICESRSRGSCTEIRFFYSKVENSTANWWLSSVYNWRCRIITCTDDIVDSDLPVSSKQWRNVILTQDLIRYW